MITDTYNTLSITAGPTTASGTTLTSADAIDLRLHGLATTAGDIAEGTTLYVNVVVTTQFTGATAAATVDLQVGVATDATGTSFGAIAASGATLVANLKPGQVGSAGTDIHGYVLSFAISPARLGSYNPYLLLRAVTGGGVNTTAGRAVAFISLEPFDGRQFGSFASGFTVK